MDEIRESLKGVIRELYGIDFEPEVTVAPENIEADYSSNVPLKLAKELHKAPMEIGEELIESFARFLARACRYRARFVVCSRCRKRSRIATPNN